MARWPLSVLVAAACCGDGGGIPARMDGARELPIALDGSLQNPCFAPDGARLLVTSWRGGYNTAPAVLAVVPIGGGTALEITAPARTSVNMPGACWSGATDRITFSSDELDDEIYTSAPDGGTAVRVTDRAAEAAFEPTFSPDGTWLAFESHPLDVEDQGAILKVRADGSELSALTDGTVDDRQPNWSPSGELIVFQSHVRTGGNDIDLFVMDPTGGAIRNLTQSPDSEDTDASFSPDGRRLVYSSNRGGLDGANLFVISVDGGAPVRLTDYAGYDGAPAWSPDGRTIAFESGVEGAPTSVLVIDAPGGP